MEPGMGRVFRYRFAKVWLSVWESLGYFKRVYPAGTFRVLLFHDIPRNLWTAFESLVRYVMDCHGVLTPEEAEGILDGTSPPILDTRIPCLLTFDDGFESHQNVAKEILNRYGLKAIFFVCPGLMDISRENQREAIARHIFDGHVRSTDLPDEMGLMSWSDLEALIASNHTVGSHTVYHRRLSVLGEIEREREIIGSSELLKRKLGILVRWFAHPFGDMGSMDADSCKVIGSRYDFCCTGIRGVNSTRTHPLGLLREQLDLASSFEYQKFVLEGGLDFWYTIQARRVQATIRKTTATHGKRESA